MRIICHITNKEIVMDKLINIFTVCVIPIPCLLCMTYKLNPTSNIQQVR